MGLTPMRIHDEATSLPRARFRVSKVRKIAVGLSFNGIVLKRKTAPPSKMDQQDWVLTVATCNKIISACIHKLV
jgi:hypothetical protein